MNKRKFSEELYVVLVVLLLLIGIAITVNATYSFYRGWHNIDLTFNACLVSNDVGTDFRQAEDFYDVGKTIPMIDLYIIAGDQMKRQLPGLMGGPLIFTLAIMLLVQERRERK